jgi:hypothetical protein
MRKRIAFLPLLFLALSSFSPVLTACNGDPSGPGDPSRSCCRVCKTGKACGDSCIARDKTCRVGPGCACNG